MRALGPLDYTDYPVERHASQAPHLPRKRRRPPSGSVPKSSSRAAAPTPAPSATRHSSATNSASASSRKSVLSEIDSADRPWRRLHLFHRRDLRCRQAGPHTARRDRQTSLSRSASSPAYDLWNEDLARAPRAAPTVSPSSAASNRSPNEGSRRHEQELSLLHRSHHRAPPLRQAAHIPWVQANLIKTPEDDRRPRRRLAGQSQIPRRLGQRARPDVSLPRQPSSTSPPSARSPDEQAWERAHSFYLQIFADKGYSDIQDQAAPLHSRSSNACPADHRHNRWCLDLSPSELTGALLLHRSHSCLPHQLRPSFPLPSQSAWCSADFAAPSIPKRLLNTPPPTARSSGWTQNHLAYPRGTRRKITPRPWSRTSQPDLLHTNQFCFGSTSSSTSPASGRRAQ